MRLAGRLAHGATVSFIFVAAPRARFCWRRGGGRGLAQAQLFCQAQASVTSQGPPAPLPLPRFCVLVSYMPLAVLASSHTKSSPLLLQADQRATTQHLTAAAHTTMASKRAKNAAKLKKLGAKAVEVLRPVLYYGFLPTVILIAMCTEPRPSSATCLRSPKWRRYTTLAGRAAGAAVRRAGRRVP